MESEVFEGIVRVDFDEGMIADVVQGDWDDYLLGHLKNYEGKKVRVTIEVLEE